jgi:tetratricopeptide (TPR) repeat protein
MRRTTVLLMIALTGMLFLSGCASKGPEERLQKVGKLFQQRDYLGARLEAKELILKYPDSEQAITAHFVLAQIYNADGQPDEALAELSQILARKSQKEQEGIQALGFTLDILKRAKRYDEAYKIIDKYQKEYADDRLTSLQLSVARADVMSEAGETTPARTMLEGFLRESTSPAERRQFRSLIGSTFIREEDMEAAARYFEQLYQSASDEEDKRDIALRTAWYWSAAGNYEKTREWTEKVTNHFAKAIAEELDAKEKAALAQVLGNLYAQVGNLEGARRILEAVFNAPFTDQEQMPRLVNDLVVTFLRMGKVDDAIAFVRKAASRFPQSPLAQQAVQMESMKAQGKLDTVDTSPLVMRFAADPVITLDEKLLQVADEGTSEGMKDKSETTAPATREAQTKEEISSPEQAAEAGTTRSL